MFFYWHSKQDGITKKKQKKKNSNTINRVVVSGMNDSLYHPSQCFYFWPICLVQQKLYDKVLRTLLYTVYILYKVKTFFLKFIYYINFRKKVLNFCLLNNTYPILSMPEGNCCFVGKYSFPLLCFRPKVIKTTGNSSKWTE